MIHTMPEKNLASILSAFQNVGESHEVEVAKKWNERKWPESAWNAIVSQQNIFDHEDPSSKESLIQKFHALQGWCKGSGDSSFCTSLIVHYLLCKPIINRYFPNYKINGNELTCFALTERAGGSTPFNMAVEIDPRTFAVNGTKWHITNAPNCDHFLVFGVDPKTKELAMAMIPAKQKGIQVNALRPEGMRNSLIGEIKFNNSIANKVVVSTPKVKRAIMHAFEAERLSIGYVSLGVVEHHFPKLIAHLRRRIVGKTRIIKHQYLQKRITDIKIQLDCLKALVDYTSRKLLEGEDISVHASEIKFMGINLVADFSENAIKCYGSYGVQQELGLMRLMADSVCGSIAGGTEEVHRNLIFSKLLREQVQVSR